MKRRPSVSGYLVLVMFIGAGLLGPKPVAAQSYEQQLKAVCRALGSRLTAQKKATAAVVDFTDLSGNITALGRFLAEELSVCLVTETPDLQVVERLRLTAVLREQKLSGSGIIDPATAKKLGEVVGAEVIVTGTLTPFGDTVRLSARALDVGTARVVAAATGDIPKTRTIEELLAQDSGGKAASGATERALGTGVSQPPDSGSPVPRTTPATQRQTVAGFTWELMDCVKGSGGVTCRIMLTNNDASYREVQIARPTALDDKNYDATARTPASLRLQPGANEVVRLTFPSGAGLIGTAALRQRVFGSDSTELASMQLEYRVAGRQGIVRFQRVPLK
jgi:TolB-like protein